MNYIIQQVIRMNCPTCTYLYRQHRKPLCLPCGHTFCSDCIKQGEIVVCKTCQSRGKSVVNIALYSTAMESTRNKNIDKFIKICFFGQSTVGKTSCIKRLAEDSFTQKTTTTIGLDFTYKDIQIDNKTIRLQLWDSAGQQQYRALTSSHYKNSDIVILVFDLSASHQTNQMEYWIKQIEDFTQSNNIIVIGNKLDLANQRQISQSIQESSLQKIKLKKWKYIQASCKTKQNFDIISSYIRKMSLKCRINDQKYQSKLIDSKLLSSQMMKSEISKIKTSRKCPKLQPIKQADQGQKRCPCQIM